MATNIHVKGILTGMLALFIAANFGACTKKIYFTISDTQPAAVGKVKIKRDNNNNYILDISITHLADPKRLSPPKDIYVVWVETANSEIKNAGRIISSAGIISKTLKGSLRTVTSFKPVRVFITAEIEGDIHHPGIPVVLTTERF